MFTFLYKNFVVIMLHIYVYVFTYVLSSYKNEKINTSRHVELIFKFIPHTQQIFPDL